MPKGSALLDPAHTGGGCLEHREPPTLTHDDVTGTDWAWSPEPPVAGSR